MAKQPLASFHDLALMCTGWTLVYYAYRVYLYQSTCQWRLFLPKVFKNKIKSSRWMRSCSFEKGVYLGLFFILAAWKGELISEMQDEA